MKTVLRRMAGILAALLLTFCSVTTFAADASSFPDNENGEAGPPKENIGIEGGTYFGIMEVSKWKYLTVIVKDGVTTKPLPGVTVKLFQGISTTPITGSDGAFATDSEGKMVFQLAKDDTLKYHIEITHLGFEAYVGPEFTLPERLTTQTISLEPVYYTVNYYAGANGSLGTGAHTEQVRWGGAPKTPPQTVPVYHHRFLYWTLDDNPISLPALQIKEDTDLYAQFGLLPQHNVYYISGGHGSLIGETHELVWEGEHPLSVPETEASEDYFFKGWQEQGQPFVYEFDPTTVSILKETVFVAVFDESTGGGDEEPPKPMFPSSSTDPNESLPQPPPDDDPRPGRIFHPDASAPPGESEQVSVIDSPQVPNAVPELLAPVVKLLNLDVGLCWLHWLILLCCLFCMLFGLLRLWMIHRRMETLEDSGKVQADEEKTRMQRHRWCMFGELALGAFCAVLWGVLFAIRICRWDILALILWAAVLLALTVLLVRAERRLNRVISAPKGNKPITKDG